MRKQLQGVSLAAVAAGMMAGQGLAQSAETIEIASLDRIVVSGASLADIGGSVQYLDAEALETFSYSDPNRILRQLPGVYLQEEEGFGLRPNIGIRGSGSDRNSRVTVMEDGVLIAPAPYAAPAAYYFPRMTRMTGVEVAKGPAAVMYGPFTTGGALNLFSTPIPDAPGGKADALIGNYGGSRLHGNYGGWFDTGGGVQVGALVEGLHEHSNGFKRLDGGGDTGFKITDMVARFGVRSAPGAERPQSLEFKYQRSDETSDETYLGLTLADFQASPFRRYRGSQVDVMDVDHETFQFTHRIDISPNLDLTTIAYRNETSRVWYKLNDVRNSADTGWVGISAVLDDPVANATQYQILVGDPAATPVISGAGDLRVRNNNRAYVSKGVQSVLGVSFATGGLAHDLQLSARYHEDSEDRFQQDDRYAMTNGRMTLVTPGAPGSQDNRIGEAKAWAFFARDTITAGNWTVIPGIRYETIDLKRTNYGGADPTRAGNPAPDTRNVDVWIPGISATYRLNPNWRLLAGVHRGFSSPGPGSTTNPETSWNYEAGVRFADSGFTLETIGFYNDYDNLVGVCTASTGGGCAIGAQFDGGAVKIYGLETMAAYDAGRALGWDIGVPLSLVHTWTQAEFRTSFTSSYGPWGTVLAGDDLPHLPEHQLTLNAGLDAARWRFNASLNYVSKARASAGSGPIPAGELVDSRVLVDIAAEYRVTGNIALFGTVTNLTDKTYNVAFSPAGARPGAPRMVMGGLRLTY